MPPTFPFNTHSVGGLSINGTVFYRAFGFSESPEVAVLRQRATGGDDIAAAGTAQCFPRFRFSTTEILKLLGILGAPLAIPVTVATVYYAANDEVERKAGAVHETTTINAGVLYLAGLQWGGGGSEWVANCEIITRWDGVNNPFVFGTSGLLSQDVPSDTFAGGYIRWNGSLVDSVQSIGFSTGYVTNQISANGDTYPGVAQAIAREVSIGFSLTDKSVQRTLTGLLGSRKSGTCDIQIRRVPLSGTGTDREPNASGAHINISIPDGLLHWQDSQVQDSASLNASSFSVTPVRDSVSRAFSVTLNTPITV